MQLAHYFLPGERPCGQLKAFRSSLYSFASAVAELQGVRLVSGSNDAEGRVEIKHEGSWGTICDGGWDPRDAMVVCRMLGFDRALGAPRSARYGQGSGRILLKYVNCEGTEDNLADCAHAGIGRFSCTHTSDAGAICYSGTHPNPFQVRLVGGSNDAEGRVEVMHEGSWGTVCDTWWDLRDARVVCRMLGFDGAVDAPGSAWFGQSSGRILLKYVNCDGTEDNLADCAHSGIGRYSCSHTRDAGAICYSGIHPNPLQVRLVGGSNDAEGRVEVMHDGSWGTICHSHWDLRDARVVCRMMGFDGALDARGSARFGQGSGRIILDDVGCEGTEVNVADCAHLGIRVHKCGHDEDAGATCYNGAHPNPFGIRLVGGSSSAKGRVEVLYDGSWGTICDSGWDLRDARVVCRMLGFDGALDATTYARFGQGSWDILNLVGCDGKKDNLADCAYLGIGVNYCRHGKDAGAICYLGVHPNPFQVRLVGGSNDAEGRVEVLHEGSWGTICHDWWDLRDAMVVCRMLGFDGALDAPGFARFGQGSGRILLDRVNCDGTEDNLAECGYSGNARYSCSHASDAGVICYSGIHPNPLQVRLVGGSNDAEGRVEVLYDTSWRTICDDSWDLRDARVVCRMLGFDGASDAPRSARFGQGSGRIIIDVVGCDGTELNVAECIQRGVGVHYCGHDEDAGAICYNGAHPNPFEIRLVDGSSSAEGRVEVLYDGSWGTICDNGWDLRDARVVCKMLGFDGALDAPNSARFGQGSEDILLDFVGCDGTEENLADCAYLLIGVHYYGHGQAVGAICSSGAHPNSVGVRLVGGSDSSEGRVEIRYNGTWGTVCNNGWDLQDAKVVCRMLGFGDASTAPVSSQFGEGSDDILLSHVGCDGTEDNLADCVNLGFGVHNCRHIEDAGVTCLLGVRLVGGAYEYEGRVEILHEGSWGTICDDLWDLDDAKVVCRQLGFDGAVAALPQARFGQGSGDIFLDSVQCNGTETSIRDCKHKGIGVHDCVHKEDASVSCMHAAHLDLTSYSNFEASGVTTRRPTTDDLASAANDTTVVALSNYNSTPILMSNLTLILVPCVLLFSIILVSSCACCLCIIRKRRVAKDVNDHIYMDVTNIVSKHSLSADSAYQDLNTPPRLPDRQKTVCASSRL
eukprot:XP_011676042.1 PREDICTED: deleted in malignant brain tumors 1 protein-like [Strongylocentrotus purpuratus]